MDPFDAICELVHGLLKRILICPAAIPCERIEFAGKLRNPAFRVLETSFGLVPVKAWLRRFGARQHRHLIFHRSQRFMRSAF